MKKVSQYLNDMIMDDNGFSHNVSEQVNVPDVNPSIESYAKPARVTVKEDNGTVHSFAVEVKSSKNGSIPDTQLMSKILQAIEGSNTHNMSTDGEEPVSFEVVSFKYERRDNKK